MATQSERSEWISRIDDLTASLREGHLFGGSFSNDNKKLIDAANKAKLLLLDYADIEVLTDDKKNALSSVMGELSREVDAYVDAKKTQKNPYSLDGDPANKIEKATGSRRVRLEAAYGLKGIADECHNALGRDTGPTTTTTVATTDLEGLKHRNAEKDAARDLRERLLHVGRTYLAERDQHKAQISHMRKSEALADDFANIADLHRDELMSYKDDKAFLEKYKENRLKIEKTVSAYREVVKLQKKASTDPKINRVLTNFKFYTGLTDSKIADAKEKVDTLELIGRHMDAKMRLATNKEFIKLSDKEKTALNNLSVQDIERKLTEAESISDEAKKSSKLNMYSALKQIKELEGIGITQVSDKTLSGSKSVHDHTKKIGRGSVRFQFLGASFKGPKLNPGVSGKVKDDDLTIADASIPVVEGKVRVLKFSSKFQSKNKLVNAGFRLNGLTAKASASVGATMAANPLDINIHANGSLEAHGLRAVGKLKLGDSTVNVAGRFDGSIGHAVAEGKVGVGAISIEDPDTKEKKTAFGVEAGGSLKAEVFTGKVTGGVSILGVKFSGTLKGSALSAGVEGKVKATTGGITLGLGAALGLGAGFEVSIDWSGLTKKFVDWRKRKAVSKQAAEKLRAEKAARKEAKRKLAAKDKDKKRTTTTAKDRDKKRTTTTAKDKTNVATI